LPKRGIGFQISIVLSLFNKHFQSGKGYLPGTRQAEKAGDKSLPIVPNG
jgi:hypothetical protein